MRQTFNRLLLRFSFLCAAVALGAIAVAHANRGLPAGDDAATETPGNDATTQVAAFDAQPIPVADLSTPQEPASVEPAVANDWSGAAAQDDLASRRVSLTPAADQQAFAAAPIAQTSHQGQPDEAADAAPDFSASGDGFYAGPEPDFGGPAEAAPEFNEPSFDQSAADAPSFDAPAFDATASPDFAATADSEPAYEVAENTTPDFAAAPEFAAEPAAAGPALDEPDFGELEPLSPAEPAALAPQAPSNDRIPTPPAGTGNHLRGPSGGSANALSPTPAALPQPAAPARAAAPSFDQVPLATPTPPARQYQPPASAAASAPPTEFGQGTLSVADAGMHGRNELRVPSTTVQISDPEASLEGDIAKGTEGTGKPGPSEIEGPQTPSLTIQKTAPTEIQVGKIAEFKVTVRNVGTVAAHEVLLRDEIPHGTELVDTEPVAHQTNEGAIVWEMGSIKPGEEVFAVMRVMPHMEGEIGSVATVSFEASASSRVRCTRPQLVIEHGCPRQVLVGENVVFSIKLSNPGTGAATNVVLEEDVPEGLSHGAGPQLEYAVGTLRPGETRLLELTLKAAKPGVVNNLLFAKGDASLVAEHKCQFEVVAPALQVGIEGPALRYLERPAKYTLKVANPGTAPARGVKLVAHLPKGMKFSGANNAGYYRQQDHSVIWNLAELPAKEMGTVELTAIPLEMGEQKIRLQGAAQMELADADEHTTTVEGLAALLFTLADVNDPIEVGGQTTYEIKVVNQGSKAATNLRLGARMPKGLKPINGDGPARASVNGQDILFEPVARLAPQSELSYKVHAQGVAPGDMRVEVQLISDEITEPIRKEESTHVYSDQ
jgi:uncharacterized repeat protein (TIGR01451 family)